ncbi:MAG TPA: hypothetical protein VFQ74_06195 [Pseudolysinimonas sp.]|nr:hypothetical protein [Pseudolysinimonas sp.]
MVPRRRRTLVAAFPLVIVMVAALSACSPLSLFASWGGTPAPTQTATRTAEAEPTEAPMATSTPSGTPTPGCVDRVISTAGTYRVDDCENLTVTGSDITVTAAKLGTLTVIGDSLKVYARTIGALEVQGDLNTIQTSDDIHTLTLTGNRNMITCHAGMTSAVVNGNDNMVLVDGGVSGDVQNNGQRNAIGGQP